MKSETVCVIGLGYVGLPLAALVVSRGVQVIGVDNSQEVLEQISLGVLKNGEWEIESLIKTGLHAGLLRLRSSPIEADVFVVCVPTPLNKTEGRPEADLSMVMDAADQIATVIRPGNLVLIESTSPPGTTELLSAHLEKSGVNVDEIFIAYCPERVLPGDALRELKNNSRVVGGLTEKAGVKAREFYEKFVEGTVFVTDARVAEIVKLTENSFRDVNIAFANEIATICDRLGVDSSLVVALANEHPRVSILQAGVGVGGHCLAVDPWFLISSTPELGQLIEMSRKVNDSRAEWVVEHIVRTLSSPSMTPFHRVVCLGLTYKPDVGDFRESRALVVYHKLEAAGLNVVAVEPNVETLPGVNLLSSPDEITSTDLVCIFVSHSSFANLPLQEFIDTGRLLDFCSLTAAKARG